MLNEKLKEMDKTVKKAKELDKSIRKLRKIIDGNILSVGIHFNDDNCHDDSDGYMKFITRINEMRTAPNCIVKLISVEDDKFNKHISAAVKETMVNLMNDLQSELDTLMDNVTSDTEIK